MSVMVRVVMMLVVMTAIMLVMVTDLREKGDDVQHAAEGAVRVHLTQIRGGWGGVQQRRD